MKNRKVTFLGKKSHHPLIQGAAVLVFTGLLSFFSSLGNNGNNTEWYISATMLLFFATGNPIMGIFNKNWWRYVVLSIISFIALGALLITFTNAIAQNGIATLSSFQQYFIAVTLFYFLTLFLVGIFRLIVNIIRGIE